MIEKESKISKYKRMMRRGGSRIKELEEKEKKVWETKKKTWEKQINKINRWSKSTSVKEIKWFCVKKKKYSKIQNI